MEQAAVVGVRAPVWLWAAAAMAVAWNVFGIVQLIDFVGQTHESLMLKGMKPAAADLDYALPVWMKLAFAVGSIGGLAGGVLLAARRAAAAPVFLTSLLGYLALFGGDYARGVFAVIEDQLAILTLVVAIAAALLAVSVLAKRPRLLA